MTQKFLAAAAILILPVAASAADLPRKAPAYAPAVAPYNWTGFYLGINAGYGLANVVIDDKDCNISCSP